MRLLALAWASSCLVMSAFWAILVVGALVTDTGDYKYDTIMSVLFLILGVQALSLAPATHLIAHPSAIVSITCLRSGSARTVRPGPRYDTGHRRPG